MRAIDFFAGCGGLSLGLERAGFTIACAVEIDAAAAATYRANHPDTPILVKDIRDVRPDELRRVAGGQKIDLIAGCAPCQGFCSLNKSGDEDPRNALVLRMGQLIDEIRPQAVIMENVVGLLTRGRLIFDEFLDRLKRSGYHARYEVVQMADYGVPQNRRRLVLVAGRGFPLKLPFPTHRQRPERSGVFEPWVTVKDAIGGRRRPVTMSAALASGGPRRFNWNVVRDLQPQTKLRLRAAEQGASWVHVDEQIRPPCHQGDYRGFMNTSGRMSWDEVSPTITGGCTTAAKGRFGHPDRRRYTISVREAAILQSFPLTYRFADTRIDRVCEQIGNAVPPLYAERLGSALVQQLRINGDSPRGRRTAKPSGLDRPHRQVSRD
jgi:DNA (cytosine-5)-methyltransferase 1